MQSLRRKWGKETLCLQKMAEKERKYKSDYAILNSKEVKGWNGCRSLDINMQSCQIWKCIQFAVDSQYTDIHNYGFKLLLIMFIFFIFLG